MTAVVSVLLAWLLFGGTHLGLAAPVVRERLVRLLGHIGFVLLYSFVASVCFAALFLVFAAVRYEGPAGLNLGGIAAIRWPLLLLSGLGWVFMLSTVGPSGYAGTPAGIFTVQIREPYGMERISRHPVFAGIAIWALAHLLLAPTLAGVVFFAGFFGLATAGAWLQDRRLCVRKGPAYRQFVEQTSFVPFAAILLGRQRLVASELPWISLAFGLVAAFALRALHDSLLAYAGLPLLAFFAMGPLWFAGSNWWVNRSGPAPSAPSP